MLLQRFGRNIPYLLYGNFYKNIKNEFLPVVSTCSTNKKSKKFQIRKISNWNNNNDGREFDVIDDFNDKELDNNHQKFCLKEMLYSYPNDDLFLSLNKCSSPKEILKHFKSFQDLYDVQHVTQTVILFWNDSKYITNNANKNEKINIVNSPVFEEFLQKLNILVPKMNNDETTCCLLYLIKIGVNANHPTMKSLFSSAVQQISNKDVTIPLSALSRLSVAVKTNTEYQNSSVCENITPHIITHIETCTTGDEMRLITICMQNLPHVFSTDILKSYKSKVKSLIKNNVINSDSVKPIIKTINFLSAPNWSQENASLIRDLLLLLTNKISEMPPKTVTIMFKVFENQLEPANLVSKLLKAADALFRKCQTPDILACIVQFAQPEEREKYTEIVKKMLLKDDKFNSLPSYFRILRSLKISDTELCDLYWTKVLNDIKSISDENENYRLSKYCHRYMFFNNNLGGTYRHLHFEKYVSKLLMASIFKNISKLSPSKFIRLSSFIIAYGHTNEINSKLPQIIVDNIEIMSNQFNITDCLQLSRGLQIAFELRYRDLMPREITKQFFLIENILNICAENHLRNENLSLNDLNCILRSLNNRKASRKTAIYKNAIEKYKFCDIHLNSRIIRDITFNLSSANFLVTNLFEHIFKYIIKNRDYIIGDTVEKIVNSAYQLGYTPESDEGLHWSGEIIKRDFQYMTSLSIVQACVALCFYKALPDDLIQKVFSIQFIGRIEEEIRTCYSKATYPNKILNQVMQLNRAVCLDMPEAQVPWFQQNYIEAQINKKIVLKSKFYIDVENLLSSIVEKEYVTCNFITPYGYIIDFVILLDKHNKPILTSNENMMVNKLTKVAILLLKQDSYCENKGSNMKGKESLKMRHLEMLGYKVININLKDWNSMYMNVPGIKLSYLKNILQIQ